MQDLAAGGIDIVTCSVPEAKSMIDAGKAVSLAVMAPQRNPHSNVPTLNESWASTTRWAPGAASRRPRACRPDVAAKLTAELKKAYDSAEFQDFMRNRGFGTTWADPASFAKYMDDGDKAMGAAMTAGWPQEGLSRRARCACTPRCWGCASSALRRALFGYTYTFPAFPGQKYGPELFPRVIATGIACLRPDAGGAWLAHRRRLVHAGSGTARTASADLVPGHAGRDRVLPSGRAAPGLPAGGGDPGRRRWRGGSARAPGWPLPPAWWRLWPCTGSSPR
jgi:hypothetical protein